MSLDAYFKEAGGPLYDPGSYSFENLFSDLLQQDYQAQVDFLRSQGINSYSGPLSPYVGATGGTPAQTDEARFEQMQEGMMAAAAGDATLNTLLDQLNQGSYVYGDAGKARDLGLLNPEQFNTFVDQFNQYSGTLPGQRPYAVGETVTGAYTAPAAPAASSGTTTTTTAPTGGTQSAEPFMGIPQEIMDLIEVGVELPIPGPGNVPLPIIFGTVQDFIDWVKSVGVDPDTGDPKDLLDNVGQKVQDIFTGATDAFKNAVKGATTGQIQRYEDFVRDLIMAGTFDPSAILAKAQEDIPDIFKGSSGTPPSGTTTTTTTTTTDSNLQLPGDDEEDETKSDPETTSDVVNTVDTTPPGYQDEPDPFTVVDNVIEPVGPKDTDDVVDTVDDDVIDYQDEPDSFTVVDNELLVDDSTKNKNDVIDTTNDYTLVYEKEPEPFVEVKVPDPEEPIVLTPPIEEVPPQTPPPLIEIGPPIDDGPPQTPPPIIEIGPPETPPPPPTPPPGGGMMAAAGGSGFSPNWGALFKYTTLTPYQKKTLAPLVDYIAQARGMTGRGMLS